LPVAATVRSENFEKILVLQNKAEVKASHFLSQQKPATSYHNKSQPLPITTQTQLKQTIVVTSRAATSYMSNRKSALVTSVNTGVWRGV
jgi:hypothetical protein